MNKDNLKFPYPVLGHLDDIDCKWSCTYTTICDDINIVFDLSVQNDFKELVELIGDKRAKYACEIQCSRTFLRQVFFSNESNFKITVHREDIRESISLKLFIIATENQPMYASDKFKEIYRRSFKFLPNLEEGEILAELPEYSLPVDIDYSEINKKPIIEIKKGTQDLVYTEFGFDTIQVMLPESMFNTLNLIKDNQMFLSIYHSSFIFNALIQAMPYLAKDENEDVNQEKQWVQKLLLIIQNNPELERLDPVEDASEIVQRLLNVPYKRMLNDLLKIHA